MNLADRGEMVGFLRKHGIQTDKSLGQHFLCAPNVVQAIVRSAQPAAGILEIGPGPGVLTSHLCKHAQRVIAVDFDQRMIDLLAHSAPACEPVYGDALKLDLAELALRLPEPRAIVSNMPYYITGPLLARFAELRPMLAHLVLMMQKEVGQRIVAGPGNRDRNALSVNLQSQFEISTVCNVPPGSFLPPPKVESIVLKLVPRAFRPPGAFEKVVRAGFAQPRKTLINNLCAVLRKERETIACAVEQAGIDPMARGFMLTESEWVELAGRLGG